MTRIAIIQGHPTTGGGHLCHALADAYAEEAFAGSHQVRFISVADLDFPLLRSKADREGASPPSGIAEAQKTMAWAEHLVMIFPLWLGGMPAFLYRWYFGAHSIKSLKRSTLSLIGIGPNRYTLIGMIEDMSDGKRTAWIDTVRGSGKRAR